ncbi:MAG: PilZ domain-containing protein [Bdellovibrionales bacterium]|nr:PilZ domain-containing protein [Bdellovibrionales bacterium]
MITNEIIYAFSVAILFILLLNFWISSRLILLNSKLDEVAKSLESLRGIVSDNDRKQTLSQEEKRFKYRAKSNLTGIISDQDESCAVEILDISKTGALIQCAQKNLVLGHPYTFKFELKGKGEFEVIIKAVRVAPEDPHQFGILFQNASLSTLREISEYVSGLATNELNQELDSGNV